MACLQAKPIVDGLTSNWGDTVAVLRLEAQTEVGQTLGARWQFRSTPTFILFDSDGRELWRAVGVLDPQAAQAALP